MKLVEIVLNTNPNVQSPKLPGAPRQLLSIYMPTSQTVKVLLTVDETTPAVPCLWWVGGKEMTWDSGSVVKVFPGVKPLYVATDCFMGGPLL